MFDNFLSIPTAVGMVISWVAGWLWKKNPDTIDKVIPIITLIIAIATQIVNALTNAKPADAAVLGASVLVGSIFVGLLETVAKAVLQWLIVTGAHSSVKNLKELPKALAEA